VLRDRPGRIKAASIVLCNRKQRPQQLKQSSILR
jgi:hypothetical protein